MRQSQFNVENSTNRAESRRILIQARNFPLAVLRAKLEMLL